MAYPNNQLDDAIEAVNSGLVTAVYSFNETSGSVMEADVGPDGTYGGAPTFEEYGGIVCDQSDKAVKLTTTDSTLGFRLPATTAFSLYMRYMWLGSGSSKNVFNQGTNPNNIFMYFDSAGQASTRTAASTNVTPVIDDVFGPSFRDLFLTRSATGRWKMYCGGSTDVTEAAAGHDSISVADVDCVIRSAGTSEFWVSKLAFWDGYEMAAADVDAIHDAAVNTTGGPGSTVTQCLTHTAYFIGGPVDGAKWVNMAAHAPSEDAPLYHDMDLTGSPTVVGRGDVRGFTTDDSDTMYARHPHDGDITDDPDELVVIDAANPLTILMRVTINDLGGTSYLFNINDSTAANTTDLNAFVQVTTGEVRIRAGGSNKLTGGNLVAGAPSNIAMTEDAAGSLVIDGVEVDTSAAISYQSGYLQVGKREGVATTLLDGTVHFFAVFGEVLTLAEQNAIFATVTGTHHWRDRLFTRRSAPPRPRAIRTRPKPRGRLMPRRRGT